MLEKLLRIEMVKAGITAPKLAKLIGISPATLYRKMRSEDFGLIEVNKIIDILHIENPSEIFFRKKATH